MAYYPNQQKIVLKNMEPILYKDGKPVGNGFYHTIYYDYVDKAAQLLNGNAFKLWTYIVRWHNQGYFDFSPAALKKHYGMSKSSVFDAKEELIKKGFLEQDKDKQNTYYFTPISTKYV